MDIPSSPTPGDAIALEPLLTKSAVSNCSRGQLPDGGIVLRRRGSVTSPSSIDRVWMRKENHTMTSVKGSQVLVCTLRQPLMQ